METLVTVGAVLLLSLGGVSVFQRWSQSDRQWRAAKQRRREIGDLLARLAEETAFTDVYHDGDLGRLVHDVRSRLNELTGRYAEASRRLDEWGGRRRWWRVGDADIDFARAMDEWDELHAAADRLRRDVERLNERLDEAKRAVSPLIQRWQALRGRLSRAVPEVPVQWHAQWRELDGELLRLSLESDAARRAAGTAEAEHKLRVWERRAGRLAVWAQWREQAAKRRPVVEGCVAKLERCGAGDGPTCQDLRRILADIDHVTSLDAVRAADDEGPWWERLGPRFPVLVSRASHVLAMMAGGGAAERGWAEARDRLEALIRWWEGPEAREGLDQLMAQEKSQGDRLRERLDAVLPAARELARLPGGTGPSALLSADRLLESAEQLAGLRGELESRLVEMRRERAEIHSRVSDLQRRIADALEVLAEAGMLDTEEYRKWSDWQREAAALAQGRDVALDRVRALERQVDLERPVVDAAVAARRSPDDTLRRRADELAQRHGSWQMNERAISHGWGAWD
ncbi:MAG: hypothetical protein IRZ33_07530, partial [Alicyclobacillaceae bacterium]|nr:hypothetical protein [Alicyclobacillaceae bacterium]